VREVELTRWPQSSRPGEVKKVIAPRRDRGVCLRARAKLVEGFRAVIDDGRGHSVVTDLPEEMGGGDTAPTALELAVMSLAGCVATIFAMAAHGRRVDLRDLEVIVEAEKPKGEHTITSGRIVGRVVTTSPEDRVKRIWEDTLRICPVGVLFKRAAVKFEDSLEIIRPE